MIVSLKQNFTFLKKPAPLCYGYLAYHCQAVQEYNKHTVQQHVYVYYILNVATWILGFWLAYKYSLI